MKVSGRKVEWRRLVAHTGLLTLASAILSLPASAAAGGQALPWEQPLTRLQQSLSGPVAGAIAIIALVVMVLGFSGVLVTTLLNLPDTTRRTLVVLFAAALLCSGFVALVVWFAVSGASGGWS